MKIFIPVLFTYGPKRTQDQKYKSPMLISHNNISYDIIWTVDIDRTSVEGLLQIGFQEARDQL